MVLVEVGDAGNHLQGAALLEGAQHLRFIKIGAVSSNQLERSGPLHACMHASCINVCVRLFVLKRRGLTGSMTLKLKLTHVGARGAVGRHGDGQVEGEGGAGEGHAEEEKGGRRGAHVGLWAVLFVSCV